MTKYILAVAGVLLAVLFLLRQEAFAPVVDLVMPRVVDQSLIDPITASTGRLDYLWPRALAFISQHPLLGGGLGGGTHHGAAHNVFLEMGVEGGVIGIMLFVLSARFLLFGSSSCNSLWFRVCGLAIASFIIAVAQTNPNTFYSIPYGFVVGIVAWLEIHGKEADGRVFAPSPIQVRLNGERRRTLRRRGPLPEGQRS